jgi:DNA mismatch repair protein MutS2
MPRKRNITRVGGSRSIDLHGKTVEEAKTILLDTINSCLLDDVEEIRVIHGFGTGKVKEAVHKILSSMKQVKEFKPQLGNAGVTIVYL